MPVSTDACRSQPGLAESRDVLGSAEAYRLRMGLNDERPVGRLSTIEARVSGGVLRAGV